MDAPWDYDENGLPKDEESKQKYADRQNYLQEVERIEEQTGPPKGYRLSEALRDHRRQSLATAMRLFQIGKLGFYSKVMEEFSAVGTC